MKRNKIFTSIFAIVISASAMASNPLYPLLNNYRIPLNEKGAVIGKVLTGESKAKISISRDTADIFRIDRDGNISLKRGVKLSEGGAFRYAVSIKVSGKDGAGEKEFELVKDEFLKNRAIAHRGAWKNFSDPQNSLKSLRNAISLGCSWSEFDVWMASDGVPVCNHDPSIGGLAVETSTSAQLTKVELEPGEFLPTLEQYLLAIKDQNNTGLVLEIKPSLVSQERTLELTNKVMQMVHDLKVQAWVNYISFNYGCLERVIELDPAAKTAYLGNDKTVTEIKNSKMWGIDFNLSMFKANPILTRQAQDLGLTVNAWTVNKAEDLKMMLDQGADFITTNEPELLLKMLKERGE